MRQQRGTSQVSPEGRARRAAASAEASPRGPSVPAGSPRGDDPAGHSGGLEAITVTTADDRVTYRREHNAQFIRPDTDGLHVWRMDWSHVLYRWDDVVAIDRPEPISPRDPRIADHVKSIGRGAR